MNRPIALALVVSLLALGAAGCGKKKPAPTVAPPPPPTAPKITPKVDAPPPPLTTDQKLRIAGDFDRARKIILEARDLRLRGEQIEREKGREAANDTLVQARRKYREAVGMTEKWVEPELHEVTDAQLKRDAEVMAYFAERGTWIQEDASMGPKLNAR